MQDAGPSGSTLGPTALNALQLYEGKMLYLHLDVKCQTAQNQHLNLQPYVKKNPNLFVTIKLRNHTDQQETSTGVSVCLSLPACSM